ncbi:MAG: enoyl-CoA hydratase/isomerase family protein [Pseudomonadales bacterium]
MKNDVLTVLFETVGPVACVTLNQPQRHNSLGAAEIELLNDIFETIESDPQLRVLLLTGAGERTFCAGAALDQLSSGEISPEAFANMTTRLRTLTVPTVCALNGSVYGGGCEVVLSCDFRFGGDGLRAFVPAAKFGLCYPPSGIARLVTTLGLGNAQKFLLAAEEFNTEQLLQMGFLTHVAADQSVLEEAKQYAEGLSRLAPLALRAMKEISVQAAIGALDQDRADALATLCGDSNDLQEGLLAAKEKRAPVFTGK